MSTRFFLANPKLDKSSLDVIVRHKGQRYKKGIGQSVVVKFWNADKQVARVTQSYRDGAVVNHEVEKWRMAIDRVLHKIAMGDIDISNDKYFWRLVECEIKGENYPKVDQPNSTHKNTLSIVEYIENVYIPRFLTSKSETRIGRFRAVVRLLDRYQKHEKTTLCFQNVTMLFYRDFNNYMISLKYSNNYFGSIIQAIKQIMQEAKQVDKLHTNEEYAFRDFKVVEEEVDSVYLTEKELMMIYDKPFGEDYLEKFHPHFTPKTAEIIRQSFETVKGRFLLGAFTGLRMSDFNKLGENNFRDGKIYVIAEKTEKPVIIPIHPIVQAILDSGFDLSLSLSEAKTRYYIKDICQYAGITTLETVRTLVNGKRSVVTLPKYKAVGTHTARRSFATNAYIAGIPAISIMKITGHKKESNFMKYIRISNEENADLMAQKDFFKIKPVKEE